MKVLLGWELGAGQGHIQRLVALAQKLETYGCEPIFALKSYQLEGGTFPWQRLIPPRLSFSGRDEAFTFADILANFGFADVSSLSAHLQAWQDILQHVQPALVMTDHAPGLVLAAQQRVPTIVIGSHFAVPPPIETFPIIRFPAPPDAIERQQKVSEAVRQVAKIDAPLGQVLNGDRSFIFSLPELDCYRCWRTNPEYVSAHLLPLPLRAAAHSTTAWAYLASDYAFRELVVQTLRPACHFKPLQDALAQQALAIHHGGLTTTIACVLAGIPQLVLPRYLEQQLTAIALQRLGVAQTLITPTWEDLLITQAQTFALAGAAHALALKLAPWNHNFLPVILQACLDLMAG